MKIFKFEVDEPFAHKHNEMIRDTRRVRAGGIGLGLMVILAAALAYLVVADRAIWGLMILLVGVALGATFMAVGVVVARKYSSVQPLYDTYPLVPAVIAEVKERDFLLLALVNTNADPSLSPTWALATRNVTQIPGIKQPAVGLKIPAAAVLGRRTAKDPNHWQEVTPMPIAWGTPDQDVVNTAKDFIPREQWSRLEREMGRLSDVKATPNNLLLL